jgi:protein-S-isoprenylcysteine O-methyltransferase Ste14
LGKALLEVLAEFAVFGALLFVCAGTLLWPAGWAFMALFIGFALAIVLWLAREEPELLAERMSSPIQRGQPLWDKVFVTAVLVLFVAWLIVMPLDAVRFGWSEVPDWIQLMGALGVVLSFYILFFPGSALLLGSWWDLLLSAVLLGLLVWRIPLEERMLENGLDGYDEYERNVRYRLIPHVW